LWIKKVQVIDLLANTNRVDRQPATYLQVPPERRRLAVAVKLGQ